MSNDSPAKLPRKKRRILRYGFVALFLLLIWFLCQLFWASPAVVVSKETTHITEPLRVDGQPDYERYLLNLYREGVTPGNNAALLIWRATWPGSLKPEHFQIVAKELGLDEIPSAESAIETFEGDVNRQRVVAWMKSKHADPARDDGLTRDEPHGGFEESRQYVDSSEPRAGRDVNYDLLVNDVFRQATERPWSSERVPPLAEWVQKNSAQIDLLVEASKRPRCYFPSPSLLDDQREPLMTMLLPGQQGAREAARVLLARSMWQLGEGRHAAAWQDVLAVHRLSCLLGHGQTLIEQLIALNISRNACIATLSLLDDLQLPADVARKIRTDLASLPTIGDMAQAFDRGERVWALDALLHAKESGFEPQSPIGGSTQGSTLPLRVSYNWNRLLADMNRWFDGIVAAAQRPTPGERSRADRQAWQDVEMHDEGGSVVFHYLHGAVSRRKRTQMMGGLMAQLLLPASRAAMSAQNRAHSQLELLRVAAALAEFRSQNRQYPESLADLREEIITAAPVDLNGRPLVYKRIENGYLLYSVGTNEKDEGGSNVEQKLHEGRPLEELSDAEYKNPPVNGFANGDDWSVRLPRPPFAIPK